ncbi:dephospho-CoA kinase [Weissella diestrammenae]|uniref:Dephospho-CoA kinase n=1 Tax=Weissella diestrammenae TaxID=1162633 RepID=A0A7G9T4W3_9LACO|nr:dephospho-CoA kinase [Weissella diestrammenae]MCM0582854.1 dephospho-CoA kinase [Weissella diestrammenae]QNN75138.1 dephospho-CoA kinase [Weissella diestrammenae]
MIKLGLTGGIATGKSTIANYLRQKGILVIDADQVARDVVAQGMPALQEIVQKFGADVLMADGTLDRKKLGEIVFNDANRLAELNQIIHPRVHQMMQEKAKKAEMNGAQLIVFEVPLLFETHNALNASPVIVVTTPIDTQIKRLMLRDGLSRIDAQKRLDAQMPMQEKMALADYVIDNGQTVSETYQRIDEILHELE